MKVCGTTASGAKRPLAKTTKSGGRPEGNANADRRQETGEGGGEAGGQAAAEVGLA
jgi:hypothetical protein